MPNFIIIMPISLQKILLLLSTLSVCLCANGYRTLQHGIRRGDSAPELSLTLFNNSELVGSLSVGTPPQEFYVAIDTIESNLFIASKECALELACLHHRTFDIHKSSTADKSNNFQVAGLAGYIARDVVTGLGVGRGEYMAIALVTRFDPSTKQHRRIADGIWGLSPRTRLSTITPGLIESLHKDGLIQSQSFSIYLGRNDSGRLVLGGINPAYNSTQFVYHQMVGWCQLPLDDLLFNGTSFRGAEPLNLIVDTEYSAIYGPYDIITRLLAGFPGSGRRTVNCSEVSRLPVLSFRVGAQLYSLTGEDYVVREQELGRTLCYVGIEPNDGVATNVIVVGSSFLKGYYTHFDYAGTIGFAKVR